MSDQAAAKECKQPQQSSNGAIFLLALGFIGLAFTIAGCGTVYMKLNTPTNSFKVDIWRTWTCDVNGNNCNVYQWNTDVVASCENFVNRFQAIQGVAVISAVSSFLVVLLATYELTFGYGCYLRISTLLAAFIAFAFALFTFAVEGRTFQTYSPCGITSYKAAGYHLNVSFVMFVVATFLYLLGFLLYFIRARH